MVMRLDLQSKHWHRVLIHNSILNTKQQRKNWMGSENEI